MTENSNKGGSWLLAIVLICALISAVLCMNFALRDGHNLVPAYRDPELSSTLVRGSIVDRDGRYLAIQAPDYGFQIHLSDASAQEAASFISGYTEENAISIGNKIENGETFIRITDLLDSEDFDMIESSLADFQLSDDLQPISVERRRYFHRSAMMVGTTDEAMHGLNGIEKFCDNELSAIPEVSSAISYGKEVQLTISIPLQQALYDSMIVLARTERAAIISPEGEVLAFYGNADEEELKTMIKTIGGEKYERPEFPHDTKAAIKGYQVYVSESPSSPMIRAAVNAILSKAIAEP